MPGRLTAGLVRRYEFDLTPNAVPLAVGSTVKLVVVALFLALNYSITTGVFWTLAGGRGRGNGTLGTMSVVFSIFCLREAEHSTLVVLIVEYMPSVALARTVVVCKPRQRLDRCLWRCRTRCFWTYIGNGSSLI